MTNREGYEKLAGGAGTHGSDYQVKLLTLFLLHGYQSGEEFWLSTENKNAGKFDDVVYETNEISILLQAKHKEDPKDKRQHITFNDLFPSTGSKDEFNLYKYMDSFASIKQNFNNVDALILCTNTDITKDKKNEIKQYVYPEMMDEGHIFSFSEKKFYYTFNQNCKELITKNSKFSEDDVDEFLEKLQLVSINDKNIDNRLETLLKEVDMFKEQISIEYLVNFMTKKVKTWFMAKGKGVYLTKEDAEAYMCSFRNTNFITELEQVDVEFQPNEVKNRYICYTVQNKEYISLHLLKAYQNLNQDKVLIINPNNTTETQVKLIHAFKMPEFVSLIIPVFEDKYEDLKKIIINVLEETSSKSYKKIVFITDEETILKKLTADLNIQLEHFPVSISYQNFSDKTRNKIISKIISFQKKNIPLKDLIGSQIEIVDDTLDEATLYRLLNNNTLVINQFYDDTIIDFYVSRSIRQGHTELAFTGDRRLSEKQFCDIIIDENKNKIILISEGPGMGKTTILTRLQNVLNFNHNYWIVKVNLSHCTETFQRCLKDKTSFTLETFLSSIKNPVLDGFETNIFNMSKKVIVMLDAVDEISPDYTTLVLDLILSCRNRENVRKILITSRPHCKNQILESTNSFTYSLDQFSEEDKEAVLISYWTRALKLVTDDALKCKMYAKMLTKKLYDNLGRSSWSLIGIPLQTRLIAEIFENRCLEYIKSDSTDIALPENLNTSKLYDMFIDERKRIYIDEKNHANGIIEVKNVLSSMFDNAITEHTKMALRVIFSDNELQYFRIFGKAENVLEISLLRMGLLQKTDTTLRFIHQTFAEYFVALHIWKTLNESDVREEFVSFLIGTILSRNKYSMIHLFMESILENTTVSYKLLEMCGTATSKTDWTIGNEIMFLGRDGRYNLLKLMLEKCSDCRGILQASSDSQEELIFQGISFFPIFELLLAKGANIFKLSRSNSTLLHWAVTYNSEQVVNVLIQNGLDVNAKDTSGNTPLHMAAERNLVNLVNVLIANKVNANVKNNDDESALHHAAKFDSVDVIPIFIQQGIDIDVRDRKHSTPLLTACMYKSFNSAKYLIDCGCDVTVNDIDGCNPLHLLAVDNYCHFYLTRPRLCIVDKPLVTRILMEHGTDIYADNEKIRSKIKLELEPSYIDTVENLLKKNVNINSVSDEGMTALHYAVKSNNSGTVKCLLEADADLTIKNKNGETALQLAAERNFVDIMKLLLSEKTNIEAINRDIALVLHYAVKQDSVDVLRLFIQEGISVNIRDCNNLTPLLKSCWYKSFDCAKCLIEDGADVTASSNEGCNALHYLAMDNYCDLHLKESDILMEYKPLIYKIVDQHSTSLFDERLPELIKQALVPFYTQVALNLIQNNIDINSVCNKGKTALHYAVKSSNYAVVQCLIDAGAEKYVKSVEGETPFDIASQMQNLIMQNLLIG